MAKITWVAGEDGTRSNMNAPFFVQSGTVAGGNLNLQISPGRMRFPYQGLPVVFPGSQAFQLTSVPVSTYYSMFMTAAGALVASGHSGFSPMPDSPAVNGEYIGTVFTGNPVNTANLVGPWNMAASGYHETRGDYTAVTPSRPRVMENQSYPTGTSSNVQIALGPPGTTVCPFSLNVTSDPFSAFTISSVTVGQPAGTYVAVHGTVMWTISGALHQNGYTPSGVLNGALALAVTRGTNVEYITVDGRQWTVPQDPDSGLPAHTQRLTTSFNAVLLTSGADDIQTYNLMAYLATPFSNNGISARVYGYTFCAEPAKARRVT